MMIGAKDDIAATSESPSEPAKTFRRPTCSVRQKDQRPFLTDAQFGSNYDLAWIEEVRIGGALVITQGLFIRKRFADPLLPR